MAAVMETPDGEIVLVPLTAAEPCARCKGNRTIYNTNGQPILCPDCGGTGLTRKETKIDGQFSDSLGTEGRRGTCS